MRKKSRKTKRQDQKIQLTPSINFRKERRDVLNKRKLRILLCKLRNKEKSNNKVMFKTFFLQQEKIYQRETLKFSTTKKRTFNSKSSKKSNGRSLKSASAKSSVNILKNSRLRFSKKTRSTCWMISMFKTGTLFQTQKLNLKTLTTFSDKPNPKKIRNLLVKQIRLNQLSN